MVRWSGGYRDLCSLTSDPSIKALIVEIDSRNHDIIIEELDDTNLIVNTDRVPYIKAELERLLAKNVYNGLENEDRDG